MYTIFSITQITRNTLKQERIIAKTVMKKIGGKGLSFLSITNANIEIIVAELKALMEDVKTFQRSE